MASKSQPLSIETLLQKQKAEKEAAAKVIARAYPVRCRVLTECIQPKFLTKEQRAQLAIEKRAQEIREQKEKEERAKREREALEREAEEIRQRERERERAARYGSGGGGRCE